MWSVSKNGCRDSTEKSDKREAGSYMKKPVPKDGVTVVEGVGIFDIVPKFWGLVLRFFQLWKLDYRRKEK